MWWQAEREAYNIVNMHILFLQRDIPRRHYMEN